MKLKFLLLEAAPPPFSTLKYSGTPGIFSLVKGTAFFRQLEKKYRLTRAFKPFLLHLLYPYQQKDIPHPATHLRQNLHYHLYYIYPRDAVHFNPSFKFTFPISLAAGPVPAPALSHLHSYRFTCRNLQRETRRDIQRDIQLDIQRDIQLDITQDIKHHQNALTNQQLTHPFNLFFYYPLSHALSESHAKSFSQSFSQSYSQSYSQSFAHSFSRSLTQSLSNLRPAAGASHPTLSTSHIRENANGSIDEHVSNNVSFPAAKTLTKIWQSTPVFNRFKLSLTPQAGAIFSQTMNTRRQFTHPLNLFFYHPASYSPSLSISHQHPHAGALHPTPPITYTGENKIESVNEFTNSLNPFFSSSFSHSFSHWQSDLETTPGIFHITQSPHTHIFHHRRFRELTGVPSQPTPLTSSAHGNVFPPVHENAYNNEPRAKMHEYRHSLPYWENTKEGRAPTDRKRLSGGVLGDVRERSSLVFALAPNFAESPLHIKHPKRFFNTTGRFSLERYSQQAFKLIYSHDRPHSPAILHFHLTTTSLSNSLLFPSSTTSLSNSLLLPSPIKANEIQGGRQSVQSLTTSAQPAQPELPQQELSFPGFEKDLLEKRYTTLFYLPVILDVLDNAPEHRATWSPQLPSNFNLIAVTRNEYSGPTPARLEQKEETPHPPTLSHMAHPHPVSEERIKKIERTIEKKTTQVRTVNPLADGLPRVQGGAAISAVADNVYNLIVERIKRERRMMGI